MDFRKTFYFLIPWFLGLTITVLLSKSGNSNAHEKGQVIILFEEIKTFLTIGLLWYSPLLFFLTCNKRLGRLKRSFIYLSCLILCIAYYRLLTSSQYALEDTRLVAGYIYKYQYYLDVGMGVFLSVVISVIFIEIYKRRKNEY